MCVGFVSCVIQPIIHYDVVNDAYLRKTGKTLPRGIAGIIDSPHEKSFERVTTEEVCPPDDPSCIPIDDLIDLAHTLCGKQPKVYPSDVQERWPLAWLESRHPSTYELVLHANGPNGLPSVPILSTYGDFNSSLVCTANGGCSFLNARSTQYLINGTLTPKVYDQALFLFKEPSAKAAKELCGFDTALAGTGLYGNSAKPIFGNSDIGGMPIFNNVANRRGMVTADSFSTSTLANGVGGSEAGIGANYYNTYQTLNQMDLTYTTTTEISSMFLLSDPATGKVLLWGFQHTTYTLPVPGLPI